MVCGCTLGFYTPSPVPTLLVRAGGRGSAWCSMVSFPLLLLVGFSLVTLPLPLSTLHPSICRGGPSACDAAGAVLSAILATDEPAFEQERQGNRYCMKCCRNTPEMKSSSSEKWDQRETGAGKWFCPEPWRPIRRSFYLPSTVGETGMTMLSSVPGICWGLDLFFCPFLG